MSERAIFDADTINKVCVTLKERYGIVVSPGRVDKILYHLDRDPARIVSLHNLYRDSLVDLVFKRLLLDSNILHPWPEYSWSPADAQKVIDYIARYSRLCFCFVPNWKELMAEEHYSRRNSTPQLHPNRVKLS